MTISGTKIRQKREALSMSQIELAHRIGVSQSIISAWESDIHQPHLKYVNPLAQELHTTIEGILVDGTTSIVHLHGENDFSTNGLNVYVENQKLTEELLNTQRKYIAELEAKNAKKLSEQV